MLLQKFFSVVDVLLPGTLPCPLAVLNPFGINSTPRSEEAWAFDEASLSPYIKYWTPSIESHVAWNMPQTLNAQGIDVVDVKNQNIFIASPISQLASTDNRNPLHDRDRAFARICGIGSVASTESPTTPISDEYD